MFMSRYFVTRIAIPALILLAFATASARAQSIGDNVVTYLNGALNTRVGGGEADHMATEALRISGAEFVASDLGSDYPNVGDKVWGTRVTRINCDNGVWYDSYPDRLCLPGDIIQFGSAVFGNTIYPQHFTAVVASVNAAGRPISIFQQNFSANRVVQQATIDTTSLTAGWMRVFRPITRIDRFNVWKFTAVNNSATDQSYQMMNGIDIDSTVSLTAANTAGSYIVHAVTTIGTVPNFLLSNQTSFFVETPKGNEVYDSPDGTAIRQLSQ
jgi:hypothetical protein